MKKCIACGCTDRFACPGGCRWVSHNPPKCSACFDEDGELRLGEETDARFAVGSPDGGLFGFELCPASETPAPHVPFFASERVCYCARCRIELAA